MASPSEMDALLQPYASKQHWRWSVLLAFSFFSFSNASMWITFAPCLYDFVDYFFHQERATTPYINAIHTLSIVYMLVYPLLIPFSFQFFEDTSPQSPGSGLRRGVIVGASLNALAAVVRWLGAMPSPLGYAYVLGGQIIAAIAQVFMLSVPPYLAIAWFPEGEINLATSVAVSANNLGIAGGFFWPSHALRPDTMETDVPRLLMLQFFMCAVVLIGILVTFRSTPPFAARLHTETSSAVQSRVLWRQRPFWYLMLAYSAIMGAQCAVITLLAQILMPPFNDTLDEETVGVIGSALLFLGVLSSIATGYYLDRTKRYRFTTILLSFLSTGAILGMHIATEVRSIGGVAISSVAFGLASYAIVPAIFQYAGELFYPTSELISTGYLFTAGNISGVLLVLVMGWSHNTDLDYPMRIPMLCLVTILFIGSIAITCVKGELKRISSIMEVSC